MKVIKERRLGRGLEALLGRSSAGDETAEGNAAGQLVHLSVYEIDSNPFQPRVDFGEDDLQGLAESIKEHGLLQPVIVRRVDDRHQLIAGERRLRAAIKAGYDQVPAKVLEADDRQMAELAIVENLQRKDLNPLEKAASFQQYLNRYGGTQEELAARLAVDRSTVTNLIRLLELPGEVQQAIRSGALRQGHARALLPLGDEGEQVSLARRIQEQGLSVRAVEELVQQHIATVDAEPLAVFEGEGGESPEAAAQRARNENLASLEQEFRHWLGTRVDLRQTRSGRGRIIVHFTSHEEFERLQCQLRNSAGGERAEAG